MISVVRTTNNALCGAITLTVLITTAKGTALATDYLIVYYLTVALFYSESYNLLTKGEKGDNNGGRSYYVLEPDIPLLAQNALFAINHLFGAWFWIQGLHRAQPTTCPSKAALLGVFDLYDERWVRFAATAAIIGGINFVVFFCVHLYAFWTRGLTGPVTKTAYVMDDCCGPSISPAEIVRPFLRPKFWGDCGEIIDEIREGKTSSLKKAFSFILAQSAVLIHFALVNLMGPLIAIVSVERMISANHLETPGILESSGQMIALFTGATSLLAALWDLGKDWLDIEEQGDTDLIALQMYQTRGS